MRRLILAAWLVAGLAHADVKVVLDPATVCSEPTGEQYEFTEYRTMYTTGSPASIEHAQIIHRCLSQSACYSAQGAISGGNLQYGSYAPYTQILMSWTVGVCHVSGN